jgi:AhpD family alkylhydroperoxidase
MPLDQHIKALVSVGAAISANCQPCLESSRTLALESGATPQEIAEAIEVGKMVRRGATSKMDHFANRFAGTGLAELPLTDSAEPNCSCH